ncbi:MAG: hypothetical protein WC790_00930 [Candidatus Paceibacterota bacterium]|jgi:hypothetical protein
MKTTMLVIISACAIVSASAQAAPAAKSAPSMVINEAVWTAGNAAATIASIAEKKAAKLKEQEKASLAGKTIAALCGEDWPAAIEDVTVNEYKESVIAASRQYMARMDAACRVKGPFDIAEVVKAYRVFTPAGMETARDNLLLKQVATMACITMYRDGEQIAEKHLKM